AGGSAPLGFRWRRGTATVVPCALGRSFMTIAEVTTFGARRYTVVVADPVTTAGVTSVPAVLTVLADSDGDHLPDAWEIAHQFNPSVAGDGTNDTDGV